MERFGARVGERHVRLKRRVDVDLAGGDVVVVGLEAGLERVDRVVYRTRLLEGFGRATPDHHHAVALVLGAEVLDVGDEGHGLVPHNGLGLDPGPVEAADPLLVEHRFHGDDAFHLRRDRGKVLLLQYATGASGLECVRGDRIPAAENDVVERRKRSEVLDERVAAVFTGAEADVCHLGHRAERRGAALTGGEHTGDEGGGHGTHAGGEYTELAGGGSDITCSHGAIISRL